MTETICFALSDPRLYASERSYIKTLSQKSYNPHHAPGRSRRDFTGATRVRWRRRTIALIVGICDGEGMPQQPRPRRGTCRRSPDGGAGAICTRERSAGAGDGAVMDYIRGPKPIRNPRSYRGLNRRRW